ncbi:hypothetical protein Stube_06310 [Streptomyces tubercidicus]|uniref:Uncharacterized protein n=1 Tax=Streptomyces tubercidicus TaxID=47759 RepID=A0A640UIT2_9ACTN|nr:hypothetical protein Stube_06310 [Streptomyces tubercidicus]
MHADPPGPGQTSATGAPVPSAAPPALSAGTVPRSLVSTSRRLAASAGNTPSDTGATPDPDISPSLMQGWPLWFGQRAVSFRLGGEERRRNA